MFLSYTKGKYTRRLQARACPSKRKLNVILQAKIRHMSDESNRDLTNNRETRQYLRDIYRQMQNQISQEQDNTQARQEATVSEARILDTEAEDSMDNSLTENETQGNFPPYIRALGSEQDLNRPVTPETLPDLVQSRGVNNLDSSTIPDTVTSLGESAANRVIADFVHLLHGDINYVASPDGQILPDPTSEQMENLTGYFTGEQDFEKAQDTYDFFATMVERANAALIQQTIVDQASAIEEVRAIGNSEPEIEENIAQTIAYFDRVRSDNNFWFDTTMGSLNASTYASSFDITRRHLHEQAPSLGACSEYADNESAEVESIYAPASATASDTPRDTTSDIWNNDESLNLDTLFKENKDIWSNNESLGLQELFNETENERDTTNNSSTSESESTFNHKPRQETHNQTPTEYVAELEQETPQDFGWSGEE